MSTWTRAQAFSEACAAFTLAIYGVDHGFEPDELEHLHGDMTPRAFAEWFGEKYALHAIHTPRAQYSTPVPAYNARHWRKPLEKRTLVSVELLGEVTDPRTVLAALAAAGLRPLPFIETAGLNPERGPHMTAQHALHGDDDFVCLSCGTCSSGIAEQGYCDTCLKDMDDAGEVELPTGNRFRVEEVSPGEWVIFFDGEPTTVRHDTLDPYHVFPTKRAALCEWLENNDMTYSPCGCCSHTIGGDQCELGDHDPCLVCVPAEEEVQ